MPGGCGNWVVLIALKPRFSLPRWTTPVNALGTADIGDAQARHAGIGAERIDLLVDGHLMQDAGDAGIVRLALESWNR
ncbi:MAG: hypothetical protein WDN06_18545 [Asticcacaulis sp.]